MFKNMFKIAFIYIATILGAGFATGKELVSFFGIFGEYGIYGFILTCILLSFFCIAILYVIYKIEAKNYEEFLEKIFGKRLGKIIEIFNICFLFVLFSAMLAGGGNTLEIILNLDAKICLGIFSTIIFATLFFGKESILNINAILCPILLIGGIIIGIYLNFFKTSEVFLQNAKPFVYSVVYSSYNVITVIAVLFSLKKIVKNKYVIIFSGILSGISIFLIGIFMLKALVGNFNIIENEALPILKLIGNHIFIKNLYIVILMLAIFTTAVGNGFALENIFKNKFKINRNIINFLIILCGIGFGMFGFSNIVEKVYPIFGYLGFFQILVILIIFFSNVIFKKNYEEK